ncbi:MAG: putative nucleic-acid-binding protein containing a Zn-ribbon [Haloquadratum walsbyi J07HQW1]|jgi:uncharacterized OB-fold protein|uniref:Putative nucleic-acid-binding protein containing a Zn-ribbon n=1 Tax=Haloquadratum walsbyi J07HQW1 TaxID=1238424 RepID=U1N5S4_9EURY|nr:MAG: putative nucleic-acid-binding protein containing a Zn-ribbon [Haloquadratum walsbyi J07HQW1]
MSDAGDAGYDELLEAIDAGEGYYLECENEHGSLPPRRVCPHCGSTEIKEVSLPETGEVIAHTTVHVPTPRFSEDAPYDVVIVDYGQVQLTGQLVGADDDDIAHGLDVAVQLGEATKTGEPVVTFVPAEL